MISSEGGEVSAGCVTLVIPPGAVTQPTMFPQPGFVKKHVCFHDEEGQEITCGMVTFLYPHGEEFQEAIEVVIKDNSISPGVQAVIFTSNTREEELPRWEEVTSSANVRLDNARQMLTFSTHHFSIAAIFYTVTVSAAALASMMNFLRPKELFVSLFWRPEGDGNVKLLICSDFVKENVVRPPRGEGIEYKLAAGPSDRLSLTCYDSYKYDLQVKGAVTKPRDRNKLLKSFEKESQQRVILTSCKESVDVLLECTSQPRPGQVLLEQKLMIGHECVAMSHISSSAHSVPAFAGMARAGTPAVGPQGAMSKSCNLILRQFWRQIIEDMNPNDVLDRLVGDGIFQVKSIDYQKIRGFETDIEQNRYILECLLRKSDDAFHSLVKALTDTKSYLGTVLESEFAAQTAALRQG